MVFDQLLTIFSFITLFSSVPLFHLILYRITKSIAKISFLSKGDYGKITYRITYTPQGNIFKREKKKRKSFSFRGIASGASLYLENTSTGERRRFFKKPLGLDLRPKKQFNPNLLSSFILLNWKIILALPDF